MERNFCEDEGRMPSSDFSAQIANDGNGDDDFFESLRKRQSANDEQSEEQKRNENMVDSTPLTMVLDTHNHSHDDIPDLTSNISPTSLSTTTSEEEKYAGDETPTYDKLGGRGIHLYDKTRTPSELTASVSCSTSTTKSGVLFRLALAVPFLFVGASWLCHEERMMQVFKLFTLTAVEYNFNSFHENGEGQMSLDIFDYYQDVPQEPRLINGQELQNHPNMSEENYTHEQQSEQSDDDTSHHKAQKELKKNNSAAEICATDEVQLQQIFDWQQPSPQNIKPQHLGQEHVSRTNLYDLLDQNECSQNETSSPPLFEEFKSSLSDIPTDNSFKEFGARSNSNPNFLEHANKVLDDLASKKGEVNASTLSMEGGRESLILAWNAARNMVSTIGHQVGDVSQHVNKKLDDLASKKAEIRASTFSMEGGRESLIHVWNAAKSMLSKIGHQVSDFAERVNRVLDDLASKSNEIHASNLSMEGGRESLIQVAQHLNEVTKKLTSPNSDFQNCNLIHMEGVRKSLTRIGSKMRKRTSKMMSRRLKVTSMMTYI